MNKDLKMKITDYARIETYCDGVPVYGFGSTFIHGVSPTFLENIVLPRLNQNLHIKDWPVIVKLC